MLLAPITSHLDYIYNLRIFSFLTVTGGLTKSKVSSPCVRTKSLRRVRLFVTLWTVARQAPLSMEFSRQEYWRGLPCPPPGDLPDQGIEPVSLVLQVDSLPLSHWGSPVACRTMSPLKVRLKTTPLGTQGSCSLICSKGLFCAHCNALQT